MRLAFWGALSWLLWSPSARATEFVYVHSGDGGRVVCGAAPAGWQAPGFDDRDWAPGGIGADGGTCAATVFARWRFDAGDELARLALATLRIRYEHGIAATLNGVEIARRRLDPGADAGALATEPHGSEAERVFVPLRPGLLRPTGNVLTVEVHPRTAGHPPALDVELTGTDGPRIVRGPYLQRLSEREVTVVFDTDLPTLGEVRWGPTDAYGGINTDAPPQLHHALKLTGLQPGTPYHYRVTARGPSAPLAQIERSGSALPLVAQAIDVGDALFHTPPAAGRPLRFVVYGDVRNGHDVHAQLNRAILDEDPDLALLTGDLVDRGSDEGDWERFFDVAAGLLRQVAIFPAVGNHEYARLGRGLSNFLALFRWPLHAPDEDGFYSFDAAGVHFIALDSNQYRSPRQLAWLARDLAEARRRGARALFAYAHEGPWSTGMHGDNSVCVHDYVPLLERYKVAMLFSGHDHDYERGRVGALDYVVTGGGGAELRNPRCGVVGKRSCPPHVLAFANEHHYVLVEVLGSFFRVCAKRPDGTPLEACANIPLRK